MARSTRTGKCSRNIAWQGLFDSENARAAQPISIMAILVSIAVPNFTLSIRQSREAVLRQDLFDLRKLISEYTLDKRKPPQSLDDLVSAGYLKQLPVDPMTKAADWVPHQIEEDVLMSPDQQDEGGIDDVHSASTLSSTDGTSTYN